MSNQVVLTVDFDSEVWASMNAGERVEWVQGVVEIINNEAYVSNVQMGGAK